MKLPVLLSLPFYRIYNVSRSYKFMELTNFMDLHFFELKRNYILLDHLHQTVLYGPVQVRSLSEGIL